MPTKKPGPAGPAWPIKPKWQQGVRERMRELRLSQHDLAKLVGVTQPAISALLRDGASHSSLVPAINKALKMKKPADPSAETTDPVRAELADLLEQLSDDDVALLRDNARRLLKPGG